MKRSENVAKMQPVLQGFEPSTSDNPLYRTFVKGTITTIGHSVKSFDEFVARLHDFGVERLVDVRSKPYSRRYPQFNRDTLGYELAKHDINYDFRGNNLGGLGENVNYYETIRELTSLCQVECIALMCSEADYKKCHRYSLITPDLQARGVNVIHITYP